jgi:glycosyltransferase involved in cell wall biosynthesis
MKIALVCPASLPATQFGGILFLAVDIASELGEKNHQTIIFTTNLDFANNPYTFNKNLPSKENKEFFQINRSNVWLHYGLFYINPKMYYEIKNSKPDIIHTIGVRSFQSFIASLVSKYHKIPLIISDQGGLTTHPDLKQGGILRKILYLIQNPMIKFIVKQSSGIVVANEYERKIFQKFANNSKIHIVKNGINLDILKSSNDNFKEKYKIKNDFILFLGRFNKVKGIDNLIKSWKIIKLKNNFQKIKLVIMGVDFGFQDEMTKMINDMELSNEIIIIKKPTREDVFMAYKLCMFLVLPSRWELSPLTPLEGFAFKKTSISTTAHGIPYTLSDGENAILVDPENSQQLSNAISNLIENPNLREVLGNRGFQLVQEECNSKKMAEKVLKVYENILNSKNEKN